MLALLLVEEEEWQDTAANRSPSHVGRDRQSHVFARFRKFIIKYCIYLFSWRVLISIALFRVYIIFVFCFCYLCYYHVYVFDGPWVYQ